MDREYIEQNLMSYLDGELSKAEVAEFERELSRHPDLLARVEQYRKLDHTVREMEIEMPAAGYFDNLAERIDARINRLTPPLEGSLLKRLLRLRPRVIAIAGSLATVLFVAILGWKSYGPLREEFGRPVPAQEKGKESRIAAPAPRMETDSVARPEYGVETSSKLEAHDGLEAVQTYSIPDSASSDVRSPADLLRQAEEPVWDEAQSGATSVGFPANASRETEIQPKVVVDIPMEEKSAPESIQLSGDAEVEAPRVMADKRKSVPQPTAATAAEQAMTAAEAPSFGEGESRVRGGRQEDYVITMSMRDSASLRRSALSESRLDSMLTEAASRGDTQGDSLAAEIAFDRARFYPTESNIEEAKNRIETLLASAANSELRGYYRSMLEDLSRLKPQE